MTGPQHYREAETLLARVIKHGSRDGDYGADLLATAQVHATLALAAATALCHGGDDQTASEDAVAWEAAAGETGGAL